MTFILTILDDQFIFCEYPFINAEPTITFFIFFWQNIRKMLFIYIFFKIRLAYIKSSYAAIKRTTLSRSNISIVYITTKINYKRDILKIFYFKRSKKHLNFILSRFYKTLFTHHLINNHYQFHCHHTPGHHHFLPHYRQYHCQHDHRSTVVSIRFHFLLKIIIFYQH